jgi:poly [ADP-ribose] polymerase 10/14/15
MSDSKTKTVYVEMSDPVYDQISKRVRQSFPNSCICWIEEVQNPDLQKSYDELKLKIGNEKLLFHGTSEESINSIAAGGFNPDYNKTSAYGKGTYFAEKASYSFSYMKQGRDGVAYMFLCSVLVGRMCRGSNQLVINTENYDSAVDNIDNPSIFVSPHAAAAYPKYIISFHKNAK